MKSIKSTIAGCLLTIGLASPVAWSVDDPIVRQSGNVSYVSGGRPLRIPAHREHRFRTIVNTDSGAS